MSTKISHRDIASALSTFVREDYRPILFGEQTPHFWTRNDFPVKSYVSSPTCQFVMSIPYCDVILANKFSHEKGMIVLNDAFMASVEKARVLLQHRFDSLLEELKGAGFELSFHIPQIIMYHATRGVSIELTCDVRRTANPCNCKLTEYTRDLKRRKLI
jgi:hypothetical protein